MKIIISFTALFFYCSMALAQKQEFGALSYVVPSGYTVTKNNDVLTCYKQNTSTGAFCIFFIYQQMTAKGNTKQCFDYYWETLVQKPNNSSVAATMQPEAATKGWTFLTGNGTYTDKGVATAAMQITFTGGDKMQNVLILTNSTNYQKDVENFIAKADMVREAGKTTQMQTGKQTNENTGSQNNTISTTGNTSYDAITVPPSWSMNTSGGKMMLEKNTNIGKRSIEFMNFIKSSGNLENDMSHIFFEVYEGWDLRIPGITLFTEADCQKGLTCQGLNYYMMSNSIRKKGPNGDVIKATVLLIQVGDKVAIINSTDNILGSEVDMALHFLLFNLKIKGIAGKNINYKEQLIGTWALSSGLYGNSLNSATSYTAEGKYYVLLQSSTTVGYDYYNDVIKRKQFKSEGVFNINGNVLERKTSSGSTNKNFIRFYSRKYGDKTWENFMSLYDYNIDKEKISSILRFQKI